MIELPDVVRNRALAAGAHRWLTQLDDLVGSLAADWGLTLGDTFHEGTEAFVAAVTRHDGSPAVLKLLVPRENGGVDDHEAMVLRLADGDGCPVLFADDPARGALLMERLGPSMFSLGVPYDERLPILCDVARRIWRPLTDEALPNGAEKAAYLADCIVSLWSELDRPCSDRTVEHALECVRRREMAHDDERAVLVHGDVHQWNALRFDGVGHDSFKLVDPDGLRAEPEYDLGVILREDPLELMSAADPFATARWMASRCGLDATAIWEWGVAERVSTGLLATKIGLQPAGRHMLDTAEHLATRPW